MFSKDCHQLSLELFLKKKEVFVPLWYVKIVYNPSENPKIVTLVCANSSQICMSMLTIQFSLEG